MRRVCLLAAGWIILTLAGAAAEPEKPKPKEVDYQKDVVPIFETKCLHCHGEKKRNGGLDMRTIASMKKGGVTGPAFVAGNAEKSLLVDLIHFKEMPPRKDKTPRVTKEELETIKAWIVAGAQESKKK